MFLLRKITYIWSSASTPALRNGWSQSSMDWAEPWLCYSSSLKGQGTHTAFGVYRPLFLNKYLLVFCFWCIPEFFSAVKSQEPSQAKVPFSSLEGPCQNPIQWQPHHQHPKLPGLIAKWPEELSHDPTLCLLFFGKYTFCSKYRLMRIRILKINMWLK